MEEIFVEKTIELKKNKPFLEEKLKTSISINRKRVIINGEPFDEYEASRVIEAIGFGFSAKKSLLLLEENISFKRLSIKDFTKRTNLRDIRARLIGTKGKTKKTIEDVSGCDLIINNNEVGIIGSAESMDNAITAITNLIRGSKQANVYNFLERMNKEKKKYLEDY